MLVTILGILVALVILGCAVVALYIAMQGDAEIRLLTKKRTEAVKVSEQGDIVEAVEEVFRKTMAERVRINHLSFKPILIGKVFQLLSYASCRDNLTESVQKKITAAYPFI